MLKRSCWQESESSAALRRLTAVALLLAVCGCAGSIERLLPELAYDPELVSGERLFDEPIDLEFVPDVGVVASDAAMRAWVAAQVAGVRRPATRMRQLIQGMQNEGYFATRDHADETLTAAEAFRTRSGNCLSYTNLFVALAREAGLDAVYQVVEVPPSWEAESGFLIRYTHVNVLLRGVRLEQAPDAAVTVDFNNVVPDPEHVRRVVSDSYAASLYYANHAVDLMRRDRPREAFAYLRRAIALEPGNADLWVNLGALYGTRGDFVSAIEAYDVAEQIDPRNRAALSGLARGHAQVGNAALAAAYKQKARNYQEANPYYHLAKAQAAYLREDHANALVSINHALELEKRSGRLHFVKGLIEEGLGDLDAARESFRLAKHYGVTNPQKLERIDHTVGMDT